MLVPSFRTVGVAGLDPASSAYSGRPTHWATPRSRDLLADALSNWLRKQVLDQPCKYCITLCGNPFCGSRNAVRRASGRKVFVRTTQLLLSCVVDVALELG